jgi:hypothetical protein
MKCNPRVNTSAVILEQSMGALNRGGIGFSSRPVRRIDSMESIPELLKSLKCRLSLTAPDLYMHPL